MHSSGHPASQVAVLLASKSLWKRGRVRDPEQSLSLKFTEGFQEMQGSWKVYAKSCVFVHCSGAWRRGEHSFRYILKAGLIPEMVKNPGVSLFPITFISRLRFHAHNIGGLLQPQPQFRSLWSEGSGAGQGTKVLWASW